ncbi:MAG: hypothetical protein CVT64_00745 [Actinobacteria bacterium HGW-Actinobacteria-4]|nr:MAG: hypothetical protein CVT64_00745 [Actinobacteria bacterium HGW-Actinobacteria-4]
MSNAWVGVSEYDRFGPWIDKVEGPEDVPRLFRTHPLDFATARQVLKVPRNIPRREAKPEMDLYDHLLILEDTQLTVLSRITSEAALSAAPADPRGYDSFTAPFAEVVAVKDVATLLDGRLTVATSGGASTTVRYNAATRPKITAMVNELREVTATGAPGPIGAAIQSGAGRLAGFSETPGVANADQLLVSDFLETRRGNPQLRAWASYGRRHVKPGGEGFEAAKRSIAHALSPMTLQGAVFTVDEHALEIFGRHAWLVRGNTPVHSSARLVVPLSAIDRIVVEPNEVYPGVAMITIHAGAWSTDIAVPNESAAHKLLSTAAGPRARG